MDLESVKRLLEKGSTTEEESLSSIDSLPKAFFDPLIFQGVHVDLIEPGRIICSMKVPPRLLNTGNFLHGGATASLVDLVGSALIFSVSPLKNKLQVSLEINVSYLDAAFLDEEIEIEGKVLRFEKTIAVVSVELRKKKTGKIFAQGRHTKYLAISSKL